ncbi:MAG: heme-binding Shp domain-containing protein, partial [Lachnospirales bacterium]
MKNILKKLISFTFIAAISIMTAINVYADNINVYDTNTYYINPETGKTDDGGTANSELGEGMCRSVIFEKALIEEDTSQITIRMLLYSNLNNIRIAVKNPSNGEYENVKYSILKESSTNDSADIKFSIPSPSSYIQIKMYVAPMGRDVCFYLNCDSTTKNSDISSFDEIKKESTKKD